MPTETPDGIDRERVDEVVVELLEAIASDVPTAVFVKYGLSEEAVRAAVNADVTLADDAYTKTRQLVARHLKTLVASDTTPLMRHLKQAEERRLAREAARDEEEYQQGQAIRAGIRKALPYVLGGLGILGTAAVAYDRFAVSLKNSLIDRQAREVLALELGARELGVKPLVGQSLEGATIRFFCLPKSYYDPNTESIDDRWTPGRIGDEYTDADLQGTYFGVVFDGHLPRDISIASAGWGNTVQFTAEQVEGGMPEALQAMDVEVRGNGSWFVLPTGAFVKDPDRIANRMFTTGAHAKDGGLMNYYLYDTTKGELACKSTFDSTQLTAEDEVGHMVTATLLTELPERNLLEFTNNETPTVAVNYVESFKEFGLDEWYQVYFPSLVTYTDLAIRDGSKRGISADELQIVADYVSKHQFEQDLLRTLEHLKKRLRSDTFELVLDGIRKVEAAPVINLTETVELIRNAAAGLQIPLSSEGGILLRNHQVGPGVITHELFHQLLQGNPYKREAGLFAGCGSEDVSFDDGDELFYEGMTAYFELIGRGEEEKLKTPDLSGIHGYYGRLAVVRFLMESQNINELMEFYTLNPSLKLNDAQKALLTEIGMPFPASPTTEQIYVILFRQLQLDAMSSTSEKERAKEVFLTLNEFRLSEGEDGIKPSDRKIQEEKALAVLELLKR